MVFLINEPLLLTRNHFRNSDDGANPDALIDQADLLVAQVLKSGRNLQQDHVMASLSLMSRVLICAQPSDSHQLRFFWGAGRTCQVNLQMRRVRGKNLTPITLPASAAEKSCPAPSGGLKC